MNWTENASVYDAFVLQPLWLSVPLYGFVAPLVVLLGSTLNAIVVIVLVRSKMRSPSHTLLLGMAVFDVLTGLCALPAFIYTYTFGAYREHMAYSACLPLIVSGDWLPTIFHTASIWTTTLLAIQRYLHLARRKVYTVRQMLHALVVIIIVATVSLAPRLAEFVFIPVETPSKLEENSTNVVESCAQKPLSWIGDPYFTVMFWFRAICIHLLPCCLLVLLNGLIIHRMRKAEERRERLLPELRSLRVASTLISSIPLQGSTFSRQSENRSTWMLVVVVFMFLVVEFPLAIFFTIVVVCNLLQTNLLWSDDVRQIVGLIVNFLIILSFPINFFIYCGMSRQFRDEFWLIMGRRAALSAARERRETITCTAQTQAPPIETIENGENEENEKIQLNEITFSLSVSNGDTL